MNQSPKTLQNGPRNISQPWMTTNRLKPINCLIINFSALAPYLPIFTYPFRKHRFKKKNTT